MTPQKRRTALLIHEPPLQVLPSLAIAIGLNNAIVLQQLHWLLENKNMGVSREGFKWIYYTQAEWREEHFTFWSTKTIQRIFTELSGLGLVVIKKLDRNDWDQRNYYRIDYDKYEAMDEDNMSSSSKPKSPREKRTHSPHDNNSNTESITAETDEDGAMTQDERYLYLCRLYRDNITSRIVPIMDQILTNFSKEFEDAAWYEPAFKIYVENNAGSWTYIERICANWKEHGFGAPAPSVNGYRKALTGAEAAKVLQGG